jgi:hypothetical protein
MINKHEIEFNKKVKIGTKASREFKDRLKKLEDKRLGRENKRNVVKLS